MSLLGFFKHANARSDAYATRLNPKIGALVLAQSKDKDIQSATVPLKESKPLISRTYDNLGGSLTSLLRQ